MLVFGLIFIFSGLAAMAGCFYGGITQNEWLLIVMGMIFGASFVTAGYFCGVKPILDMKYGLKRAKLKGRKFLGVIVDYDDDTSMYVNGMPLLSIVMKADIGGTAQFIGCSTKQCDESKYPKGAFIDFYFLGGDIYIDPETVRVTNESRGIYNEFVQTQAAAEQLAQANPVQNGANPAPQPIPQYDTKGNQVPVDQNFVPYVPDYSMPEDTEVRYLNGKPVDKYGNPL